MSIAVYVSIFICIQCKTYLIYELTMSVLVALVFVVTPTLTHLFIWWLGACKRWYRGCTVLCAFLFAQHSCQERKMGVKRGKEPEMNFVAGMFSLSRNQECERGGMELTQDIIGMLRLCETIASTQQGPSGPNMVAMPSHIISVMALVASTVSPLVSFQRSSNVTFGSKLGSLLICARKKE